MDEIAIDCLTTRDLAPVNSLFPVLRVLERFLQWQEFRLVWMGNDRQQHSTICAGFNESILQERWATGAIAIEDLTGKSWSAGLRRSGYTPRTFKKQLRELRQTEMTVSISEDSSQARKLRADPASLITEIYRVIEPNCLIVRESRANIFGLSLSATHGLPDLYWINVFGPPYVKLFTREKLLRIPAYKVFELSDRGIYLQLTETPMNSEDDKWDQQRRTSIESLGPECFSPIPTGSYAGGQFSPFNVVGLIKSFLASSRSGALGRNGRPLRVPEIDWAQLIQS
jgi:hypothetical protein